jgi:hypothetical protein
VATTKARLAATKTIHNSPLFAEAAIAVNCVLSPSSAKNTVKNVAQNTDLDISTSDKIVSFPLGHNLEAE